MQSRAEVRRSFIITTVRDESQVTFELETNGFQLYAIANLDKTSLSRGAGRRTTRK